MEDNTNAGQQNDPANTAAQSAQTQEWYSAFGFESEDAFKQEFEQLKGYKTLASELDERAKDVEEGFAILQAAEDPYAGNEEARMLVEFSKKGIPSSVANKLMKMDVDLVMSDPLSAIVAAEAIKNAEKFKKLGEEVIEEAVREKYGIGPGDYDPTALMKSDALDAAELIVKLKKDVAESKNPFIFAKELKTQNEKTFAERQTLAFSEAENFSKQLKEVPYKFGENQVSLKVSSEETESILKSQYASYLGRAFDPTTQEGKKQIQDWVSNQILVHKVQTGELGIQIQEAIQSGALKAAVQTVYNGQPKMVNRVGKVITDAKNLTPAQKDLLARGVPLPSQQIQSNP
jgi:hypothetical protein